jgi:electron transport complex protein RnfC
MEVLGVDKGYIGIEDNKPDAIDRMHRAVQECDLKYTVVPLKTKYPQGAEKMLIQAILNRRVPSGGLPMDVGVVVHNVGTALAVAEAIIEGKPLIQRIVTVTGDGVSVPGNVLARIGAPIRQLIAYCGGLKADTRQVFLGGPMMGMAQYDLNVPVLKSTSGIICLSGGKIKSIRTYPCIRCGTCVNACPVYLLPTEIAKCVEMKQWERVDRLGIDSCIECGACAFVCPSRIPIVQWIRVGKQGLRARAIQPAA